MTTEEPATLTDGEALSLLAKMDTEQQTLSRLWPQFSVAITKVGRVVRHVQGLLARLPELEARRQEVEAAIARLEPDFEARKRDLQQRDAAFRRTLEAELAPLRTSVEEARTAAQQAQADLAALRENHAKQRAELDQQLSVVQGRLAAAKQALADFVKAHQLA